MKVAVFNDTRPARHLGCDLVMRELASLLGDAGMETVFSWPVGRDWRGVSVPPVDAIIVNGEGTIHHDRPAARRLAALGPFARDELKVPAFLINALIHDIGPEIAENLRAFSAISVRDTRSRAELGALGIDSSVVPDLTLNAVFPANGHRQGVCGIDSVRPAVTTVIGKFCRNRGHRFMRMKQSWKADPLGFLRYYVFHSRQPERFARTISLSELVITGRFHGAVYCLLTRTPFLAVESNTPKIATLLADSGLSEHRLICANQLETLDIDGWRRWEPEEEEHLRDFVAQARTSIRKLIDSLSI